jgi:hypothetical protein
MSRCWRKKREPFGIMIPIMSFYEILQKAESKSIVVDSKIIGNPLVKRFRYELTKGFNRLN